MSSAANIPAINTMSSTTLEPAANETLDRHTSEFVEITAWFCSDASFWNSESRSLHLPVYLLNLTTFKSRVEQC